jgi:hypothetical protein
MFKIFKSIISESTALQCASYLTGLRCRSINKVEQIIEKYDDKLDYLFEDFRASIGVKEVHEFGLYAYHNEDEKKPIVTIFFEKGIIKSNDRIYMRLNFAKGKKSSYVTIGLSYEYDISSDKSIELIYSDIESAVELAKWMIADGLGLGKIQANSVITRTDYNPRIRYDEQD